MQDEEPQLESDVMVSNEIELRRLELEWQFREKERQREHELELARLRGRREEGNGSENGFMYKAKNLIPKFSEEEPDDFFSGFEEVAQAMGWEKDKWPLLVQSVLIGKALSVALALGAESKKDYETLKEEVLKAYQITPEYYRVKFRNARKKSGQKYAEYAHALTKNFNKWWKSLEVTDLAGAREACLMEQFIQGVDQKVRVFLCERQVKAVDEATKMAEDYEILMRPGFGGQSSGLGRTEAQGQRSGTEEQRNRRCYICGSAEHRAIFCPRRAQRRSVESGKTRVKCFTCGSEGHLAFQCNKKKGTDKGSGDWRGKANALCSEVTRKEPRMQGETQPRHRSWSRRTRGFPVPRPRSARGPARSGHSACSWRCGRTCSS